MANFPSIIMPGKGFNSLIMDGGTPVVVTPFNMTPFSDKNMNDVEMSVTNIEMDDTSLFDVDIDIITPSNVIKSSNNNTFVSSGNNTSLITPKHGSINNNNRDNSIECSLSLGDFSKLVSPSNNITPKHHNYYYNSNIVGVITPLQGGSRYNYGNNSNEMSLSLGLQTPIYSANITPKYSNITPKYSNITPKQYTPSYKSSNGSIIGMNMTSKKKKHIIKDLYKFDMHQPLYESPTAKSITKSKTKTVNDGYNGLCLTPNDDDLDTDLSIPNNEQKKYRTSAIIFGNNNPNKNEHNNDDESKSDTPHMNDITTKNGQNSDDNIDIKKAKKSAKKSSKKGRKLKKIYLKNKNSKPKSDELLRKKHKHKIKKRSFISKNRKIFNLSDNEVSYGNSNTSTPLVSETFIDDIKYDKARTTDIDINIEQELAKTEEQENKIKTPKKNLPRKRARLSKTHLGVRGNHSKKRSFIANKGLSSEILRIISTQSVKSDDSDDEDEFLSDEYTDPDSIIDGTFKMRRSQTQKILKDVLPVNQVLTMKSNSFDRINPVNSGFIRKKSMDSCYI